jgi:ribosomal protein L29
VVGQVLGVEVNKYQEQIRQKKLKNIEFRLLEIKRDILRLQIQEQRSLLNKKPTSQF